VQDYGTARSAICLRHRTRRGRSPESIYDGLVEVTEELQELPEEQLEQYRVVWESAEHNHNTSYSIRGLGNQFGETTVEIIGEEVVSTIYFQKETMHLG